MKYKPEESQVIFFCFFLNHEDRWYGHLNTDMTNLGVHTSAELILQGVCLAVKVLFEKIKIKIDSLLLSERKSAPWFSPLVTNSIFLNR